MAERVLRVAFLGDASNLQRATGQVEAAVGGIAGATDKAGSRFSTGMKRIGESAGRVASRMKYVTLGVGALLFKSGQAASDLGETVDFTRVTFEKNARAMEKWGDSALSNLGLAKQTALDAANGFGGLFKPIYESTEAAEGLSKQMVALAVDMASAKNVPLEEALDSLKSALIGESEPIRKFNVLLSESAIQQFAVREGIIKANETMTEQEKVQARLGLIMEQTKDIQGNYADTADSAANAQRRAGEAAKDAAAKLGTALAPVMAKVANLVTSLFEWFSKLSPAMQKTILITAAVVAALGPLAKAIQVAILAVKGIGVALSFLAANPVGAVITAIGLLTILIITNWDRIMSATEGLRRAIGNAFGAIASVVRSVGSVIMGVIDRIIGAIEWAYNRLQAVKGLVQGGGLSSAVQDIRSDIAAGVGGGGRPGGSGSSGGGRPLSFQSSPNVNLVFPNVLALDGNVADKVIRAVRHGIRRQEILEGY